MIPSYRKVSFDQNDAVRLASEKQTLVTVTTQYRFNNQASSAKKMIQEARDRQSSWATLTLAFLVRENRGMKMTKHNCRDNKPRRVTRGTLGKLCCFVRVRTSD